MKEEIINRAKKIKLFAHDVHGIITPNTFLCDLEGKRFYPFWHMDGFGDLSLSANGINVAILDTTSVDEEGLFRAKELKLENCYYRVEDKMAKLMELKKELQIEDEEIAFVGCEIYDIKVMKTVGLAFATQDARKEVKEVAHYVTKAEGGKGVIREICEIILRAQDKWEQWVETVKKRGYK